MAIGKHIGAAFVIASAIACSEQQPAAFQTPALPPPAQSAPAPTTSAPVAAPTAPVAAAPPVAAPPPAIPMQPGVDKNRPMVGPGQRAQDPNYCKERRVSYSKPCSDDPDPCKLNSGFPGDEFCWPAPAPGEGIQIHVGPKDYKNPEELAKYVIDPGSEFNNSVIAHIPVTEERFYNRVRVSMRPGSHHWLSSVIGGQPEERFYEGEEGCYEASSEFYGTIGGGQTLIYDNPPGGMPAPENAGVGGSLPPNASVCMNLHAYNYAQEPHIREMWINIYFVDKAQVTTPTEPIALMGGLDLNLPPGETRELVYTQPFAAPGRIIQLWGHRHVWTPRFAVWINENLIYDSWDWRESVVFNYDSITANPAPNPALKIDGASTGPLMVKEGDNLKFSCLVENGSDQTLTWRNDLYGGEMCNLWGTTVGEGTALTGGLR